MSIENRPYVGTWRLDSRELVQHTPDALVYINGDTTLPGCPKCNGRIDIQRFITEVSVDAGTDPGSASANFTLSIPLHHSDSFARDAKFILTPGLEVHIYMRGYFPVKGLFHNLAEPQVKAGLGVAGEAMTLSPPAQFSGQKSAKGGSGRYGREALFGSRGIAELREYGYLEPGKSPPYMTEKWTTETGVSRQQFASNLDKTAASMSTLHQYLEQQGYTNVNIRATGNGGVSARGHVENSAHNTGQAVDMYVTSNGKAVDRTVVWASMQRLQRTGHLPPGGSGMYLKGGQEPNANPQWSDVPHMDHRSQRKWVWVGGENQSGAQRQAWFSALEGRVAELPPPNGSVQPWNEHLGDFSPQPPASNTELEDSGEPSGGDLVPVRPFGVGANGSLLDQYGLGGKGIENLLSYPYYHVFHGVVTQVAHSWSGGVNTVTVNAVSMLHFWQYHTISTNASIFGARPSNSKLKTSMVGHNFTGMHPYQIMYTLHHDMVGAAGGVGWAMSSKSNQSAVSEVAGESLFSLNIRYWEKRFAQRMVKLRMHGASGELFSAAQSTFLGRNSTDSLKQLVRFRFSDPSSRKGRAKEIMEDAVSVGLFNQRKLEALLFARNTSGNSNSKGGTKFELNLAEMQAFVSDIGNWGTPAMFESVYGSKLDIAQAVMEITGFEFYQDVDGDFVFKPPMYNLDTSSSRIYRIEDVDIISISTDEKEPQATYATVKGSQFKNLQGTGVENEWGVRGQYIDYRLVAQFGWRPAPFETAYFNDPKSMFFSAINRLDILNAPSKAAQVTIPVRPELRPGYPVYIKYLDAFYYCNGFSHSHSVGGQCTTNLQLVGKRAKFYAPGRPEGTGIDAIDLANTVLPPRPLHVADMTGHPRLAGFPNVVMALDPYAINPLFWVVGADIERLDDPVVLRNILQMGSQKGIGLVADQGDGRYTLTLPTKESGGETKATTVEFYLSDDTRLPEEVAAKGATKRSGTPGVVPKTTIDIIAAGEAYAKRQRAAGQKIEAKQKSLVALQGEVNSLTSSIARAGDGSKKAALLEKKRAKLAEIRGVLREVEAVRAETEASFGQDTGDGVYQLQFLIKAIGERYFLSGGQDLRRIPETHALLDMLSEKKASLSNGTQPGQYRYYSASHPDPQHQGQEIVEYSNPPDGTTPTLKRKNSFLDPEWQGTTVTGFVRTPSAVVPGTVKPEATLGEVQPTRGIRVLTANPARPNGEIVPTSQIRELMFSVQDMTQTKGTTDTGAASKPVTLGPGVLLRLKQRLNPKSVKKEPSGDQTTQEFYRLAWSSILADFTVASVAADRMARELDSGKTLPLPQTLPALPDSVVVSKGSFLEIGEVLSNYRLDDTRIAGVIPVTGGPPQLFWSSDQKSLGGKWGKKTIRDLLTFVGEKLAESLFQDLTRIRGAWVQAIKEAGYEDAHSERIFAEFNAVLAARWKVDVLAHSSTREKKQSTIRRKIHSPVFPVSDAQGYEVVGSYRYGRGVDIEPGGVWDSLHAQDPLQFLDRKTVEDIVDGIISGKTITVEQEKEINGGKKVRVQIPLSGKAATTDVERRALAQLRRNLTDKQILDLGLAVPNSQDPSLLQLNLSNWFADGNKEGIHKLPVNNAAFTLADLSYQQDGRVCSCKAAEADLLLEAFVDSNFLQFAQPGVQIPKGYGTGEEDRATQFLTNQAMFKSVAWQQRQDALRGAAMERPAGSLISTFQNLGNAVVQGATGESARQRAALTQYEQAKAQAKLAEQGVTQAFDNLFGED